MTSVHLTEELIQQYVLDKDQCSTTVKTHMENCLQCQASAEVYRSMFADMQQLPTPAFDFDLSAMVMGQLPVAPASAFSWGMFTIYLLSAAFIMGAGILIFIFNEYLQNIFKGIGSNIIWLCCIGIVTMVICQALEMYKKYRQKIISLEF